MKIVLKRLIRKLTKDETDPLITINISREALLHNLSQFQKIKPENKIAPVLKSNAYGHGLIQVAKVLENKVDFFVVDSYFEALALRNEKIRTPLLIMGYVRPETITTSKLKHISYVISSFDTLSMIKSKCSIHLKIDTGMHRQGIMPNELDRSLEYIKSNQNILLEGICSHLADSDSQNSEHTDKQISLWNSLVEKSLHEFPSLKYTHLSNSYGSNFINKIKANTSRLGIGLYGLADINGLLLKPALEMNTIITCTKKIKKGDSVGYNASFIAPNDMTIATIPVGYYEGLDRRLSNKGFVKIGNFYAPIIGKVSMNMTTIDISEINDSKIGTQVQVISPDKNSKNSIFAMAQLENTITYELVVKIPKEIKRVTI